MLHIGFAGVPELPIRLSFAYTWGPFFFFPFGTLGLIDVWRNAATHSILGIWVWICAPIFLADVTLIYLIYM